MERVIPLIRWRVHKLSSLNPGHNGKGDSGESLAGAKQPVVLILVIVERVIP